MTEIRAAVPQEYVTVRSILEGALLEVEAGLLRRSSVLVASERERILGSLVLRGPTIEAIAIRPGRRGQGIGTMLIEQAMKRRPRLIAAFDPSVRPFYANLGFEVSCEADRCRGVYKM